MNIRAIKYTIALTLLVVGTGAHAECHADLSYLADKLPKYDRSDLDQIRNMILGTDLRSGLDKARSQGYTPSTAAAAALQQAQASEQARPQAEECVRSTAVDPDGAMRQLENGTYSFTNDGGVMDSCAAAYVLFYYSLVANKEAAIGMACIANSEP